MDDYQAARQQEQENQNLRKLKAQVKLWKILAVATVTGAIIALILFIVFHSRRTALQSTYNQKVEELNDYKDFVAQQAKNYTLQQLDLNNFMLFSESDQSQGPIRQLDLQFNNISQFSFNRIPGLQALYLSNNPLLAFEDNYLPQVSRLQVVGCSDLDSFLNNSLPNLQQLQLSSIFYLSNFTNNTLLKVPKLNVHALEMSRNTLPRLTSLMTNSFDITYNNFPELTEFDVLFPIRNDSNPDSFRLVGNNFSSLEQFAWNLTSFQVDVYIQDNTMPSLTKLSIPQETELKSLKNNYMPGLIFLDLGSNTSTSSITDNYFGKVDLFQLFEAIQLTNFSGNTMPQLTSFSVSTFAYLNFQKNNLPSVRNLIAFNGPIEFNDNVMPNIESLILMQVHLTDFSLYSHDNLASLALDFNNIYQFDQYNFPKLQNLSISNNQLQSFTDNIAPNLSSLNVQFNQLEELNLTGYPQLNQLLATNNTISNLTIPATLPVTTLALGQNRISEFVYPKETFPNLNTLDLSGNLITKFIVQLPQLTRLTLLDNPLAEFSLKAPQLQSLFLSSDLVEDFSNNDYPSLNIFVASFGNGLKSFNNNKLPEVKTFEISGINIQEFSNNTINTISLVLPSCNIAVFTDNFLTCVACFLRSATITSFFNNTFYDTNQVQVNSTAMVSFSNNKLFKNVVFDLYGAVAESIQNNAFVDSVVFKIYRMPKLTSMTNNTFQKITNLAITNTSLTSIDGSNKFVNITFIDFSNNKIQSYPIALDNCGAVNVILNSNKISSFENHTINQVNYLNLRNNTLTSFKNNKLPSLSMLYLSNNLLDDSFVNDIISMAYPELQILDISNNSIVNKDQALRKIQEAFPNAQITI